MGCAPRSRLSSALLMLGIGGVLLESGCDESLPPRLSDPNPLAVETTIHGGTCKVVNGVPSGGGEIFVQFENTYSEVLQDSSLIDVECDASLPDYPGANAHISFGQQALEDHSVISGAFLTLPPGQLCILDFQWSHRTSAGSPFWRMVPLETYFNIKQEMYQESLPVRLTIEGTIRFFRKLPVYKFPRTTVSIVYQVWGDSVSAVILPAAPTAGRGAAGSSGP